MLSRRLPRSVLLASAWLVPACSPDVPIGDRPDARPGNDAALAQDAGPDAPAAPDAFVALDAFAEADAFVDVDAFVEADAFVASDAFVPVDTGSRDAGSDAGPDAPAPRDAGPSWTIGFCRIQAPTTVTQAAGATTTVFGRVYAAGLTDRTGRTDTDALLRGELGVGPDGTLPSSPGWTWVSATANGGYAPGSPGHEPNNDEYQADLSRAAAGSYDYAYRFSGDGGATWTYCDSLGPGSSDGYQLANAGSLTVM
jgi:hypothetical protein